MAQKLKNLPAGDLDLIPGSGLSLGEGNGNPLSILARGISASYRNADRSYSSWGCKELDMTEQLTLSLLLGVTGTSFLLIMSLFRYI